MLLRRALPYSDRGAPVKVTGRLPRRPRRLHAPRAERSMRVAAITGVTARLTRLKSLVWSRPVGFGRLNRVCWCIATWVVVACLFSTVTVHAQTGNPTPKGSVAPEGSPVPEGSAAPEGSGPDGSAVPQ